MNKLYVIFSLLLSISIPVLPADTHSRPDSHAPVGVMGDHAHKKREFMLSYRFMAMDMHGLQFGSTSLKPADVLKDFMMAPTAMQMPMHMFGAMYASHDKITFMGMTSYQQRQMEMEGSRQHIEGSHEYPVGHHKMPSIGIGDVKLEGLVTLWKRPDLTLLANVGVSLPTGSISEAGETGNLLPYPMQLGSGSFEAHPGVTLFGYHRSWSYGSQLRGVFPLHVNASEYQHGHTVTGTVWGAQQMNDWLSLSSRLLFSQSGNLIGGNPALNSAMSPSHRSDSRGGTWLESGISSNLRVPKGPLVGQRLVVELVLPVYQNLTGTQLKNRWRLIPGWQYAFHL